MTDDQKMIKSPEKPAPGTGFLYSLKFKLIILVWYSIQNSVFILLMSYTRIRPVKQVYYSTVAVFFTEIIKLIICFLLVFKEASFNPISLWRLLRDQLLTKPKEVVKVCIPSMLYVIQNNILYIGASHLNATAFMITLQLKLAAAALFSVILLKRRLNLLHWCSLAILLAGVCIVQVHGAKQKHHTSAAANQMPWLGFLVTVLGCLTSGYAGVYLEKIYKDSSTPTSLWMRNIQMAVFGIPATIATIAIKDGQKILDTSILFGFDWVIWFLVGWLSIGGLTVGACIKYADNITKDMATSMAIVFATVGSMFLFAFMPNALFGVGAILVISAIFLYSYSTRLMTIVSDSIEKRKQQNEESEAQKKWRILSMVLSVPKKGKVDDLIPTIENGENNDKKSIKTVCTALTMDVVVEENDEEDKESEDSEDNSSKDGSDITHL